MKITKNNYFEKVKEMGFENLPLLLKQVHSVIMVKTDNGKDWTEYKDSADLKKMVDTTFTKLEEFIAHEKENLSGVNEESYPELERAKEDAKGYHKLSTERLKMLLRLEKGAEYQDGLQPHIIVRKSELEKLLTERGEIIEKPAGNKKESKKNKNPYSLISKEVQFIQRFLDFNDKILYKKTFEIFIDELQKAIADKKITKKSVVAKDIMAIQQASLAAFNSMSNAKHFVLKPTTIKRLKSIIEKYENAYDDIDQSYVKTKKKKMDLSGINQTPQVNIMTSTDFTNLRFKTIGFKDKWLAFIGDPAPGFTAMVFGMPKMGKSYLCVDFAGYLARNHGKVLYVAKEEKLDKTLQDKLNDKQVAHENLFVADALPTDLTGYDFIFLDSVNKLGLSPKDLNKLKTENPGKSFIYIFQATKGGQFKGNNEFQHDVDVVIEVPEQGKAVQYGRFNQGGEMNIFESTETKKDNLDGTPNKGKYPSWTTPKHLNAADHHALKYIYDLYKAGKLHEAMDYASFNADTVIREEIPADIWKKMGGQLTKTGEEKLKSKKNKSSAELVEQKPKKPAIVFNMTVRALKGLIEREWDRELTDGDYIEILDIAEKQNSTFADVVNEIDGSLKEFLTTMWEAVKEWDQKENASEKIKSKFDPTFYANRKDAENPDFIFSLTSTQLLVEALKGDFDMIYLVRRELAKRGQDSQGRWVGFDEAEKIHKTK